MQLINPAIIFGLGLAAVPVILHMLLQIQTTLLQKQPKLLTYVHVEEDVFSFVPLSCHHKTMWQHITFKVFI